ncbi:RluA family pseudouridine synthase [Ornatilinea apprima]|uniref:RluA family pseudouridine synthase n=1 Tax=Ornatilinea apprima TaxID=1134406 RepID=UPI000B18B7A7|nr:RluA family pseudouridine synthase [Ornatilinea apprima]
MNNEIEVIFRFDEEESERLDKFLARSHTELSRSRIQALIEGGLVTVDDKVITKTGYALERGQQVNMRVPAPEPSNLIPESIPLDVIFENDDLLVINKPAGMVVHPAAGHSSGTVVHAALAHAPEMEGVGGVQRPGIVHRLDKDTSGLLLIAKNDKAHQWLQSRFKQRSLKKVYLALVDGAPPTPSGRIEAPIGRDPAHRKQMAILPPGKGREAFTEYRTLESFEKHTLLEVNLLTGRTHQIRLHMAFLGCPIVGDGIYGHRKVSLPIRRQFLHAQRLTIQLPGEKSQRTFEAPLPADLQKVLDLLHAER